MVETARTNTKKTFFSGVLLLSLSTVLVKIIGLIYKIPMLTYLGSEGMGYFNSAYEIYALFCVISTAGLPVALSVLISNALARREHQAVDRIYRAAMSVFVLVGALGSLVMYVFAPRFCQMIQSEHAYACIVSIAPTVFLICMSSALRGYFQGYQKMLPTALSQILESVGKLVFGLLLARYALNRGYDTATVAAFAGMGLTLGTAVSFAYLCIEKIRFHPVTENAKLPQSLSDVPTYRLIWKRLATLAIPMTVGASLVSLTKLIDMAMILRRLQSIGYTETLANEAYGSYTTLALSVYGLLPTLVNSIALPLVPMLSAAIAEGDREKQARLIRSSYRLTALFAIPATLGIAVYARPILALLFSGAAEAIAVASPLLSYLGISVFLSCMITATNSVLHAYQSVNRPILSMLVGAAVKITSAYFLIGNAEIALRGAPISTFLCNAAVVFLNFYFACKLCRVRGLRRVFGGPLLSTTLSVGMSYAFYALLAKRLGEVSYLTFSAILVAGILYLLFSCLLGVIRAEDVSSLPMGERLCACLQKLRLLESDEKERNRKEHVLE